MVLKPRMPTGKISVKLADTGLSEIKKRTLFNIAAFISLNLAKSALLILYGI
jgi:hypothetical protein